MSGSSLTLEHAQQTAAERGLVIRLPKPNQLFVDLDDDASHARFTKMVEKLREHERVCRVDVTPSASGLPHRHAVVDLGTDVGDLERLLLQACLGSDPVRELLGWARIRDNVRTHTTLFFERPTWRERVATWLRKVFS